MKNELKFTKKNAHGLGFLALLVLCSLFASATFAQTAGGTVISNQASATYSDGTNTFSTVSNTVTVTVARVSGLTITPDAGSRAAVTAGQTGVLYSFRVTNTGNFADQIRFLAGGNSVQLTGSGTVTGAVIDSGTTAGSIDAGDTNIFTNGADVLSASILQNGFIDVLVEVSISGSATAGNTVNVQLGDTATGSPTFDNQPSNTSVHEVRTVSTTSVNGLREAKGDVSATIDSDAQLLLTLTAPSGPLALGSDINYTWQVCNTGARPASSITLANAPSGFNTGVFIFAPIPVGTSLKAQTFPTGTLYTTSPLSVSPLTAVWTTTAPSDLSTVRRIGFNTGSTLAVGACAPPVAVALAVMITTTDATNDIFEIGDAFANNSVAALITDQSGDTVSNAGDGNADFNEGDDPGNLDGNGIQQVTTLLRAGSVLIGPSGVPAATGPNSNNDDYTNRAANTGIAGIAFGGVTTASGQVVFTNTIRNTGNATDTFVLSRRSAPAGFTVEISTDGGGLYTTVTTNTVNLTVATLTNADILVRVTAPAGQFVMTDFPVVIRATSTNTPASFNETIDRLYTGALRMTKTATVTNGTGVGGATDAVPGAVIEYTITYTNVTSTGGTGSSGVTISNLVITENGSASPNNWATTTTQVVGSASDNNGGVLTGDSAGSGVLTNTVPTLAAGVTGTFKFSRTIN